MKLDLTFRKIQPKRSQEGVTLLISVLVMSGLALISLSVAAFAIQELRASRAVIATEPAISAAESGGEEGLWAIKRLPASSLVNCATGQTPLTLSNGSFDTLCKTYGSAVIKLQANVPFIFYLYDPGNINGDMDLLAYPYTNLTVIDQSGTNNVSVNIVRIDQSATLVAGVTVPPGATQVINIISVGPGSEGRMKVTLLSVSDTTVNFNTNQGMPNFPTINSGGCAARTAVADCDTSNSELFSRRINITVPQPQ